MRIQPIKEYRVNRESFKSVIDYILSLQVADVLSGDDQNNIDNYKVYELKESDFVEVRINDKAKLHFFLYRRKDKIDIEGYTRKRLVYEDILSSLEFNIDRNLTNYDYQTGYFFISLNEIPEIQEIQKLKELIF